jgi:hypothetical protein
MGPPQRTRIWLEDLLLRHGAIDQAQLQRAREEQRNLGGDLGRVLVDLGFISEDLLMRALAHQLGIPRVEPDAIAISPELLRAVTVQVCERFGVIPVKGDLQAKTLTVATSDPASGALLQSIEAACGFRVEPAAATSASIERGIRVHYYGESPSAARAARFAAPAAAAKPKAAPAAASSPPLELERRVERIERLVRDSQFVAAALARIDRLEQMVARDGAVLRAIGDLLIAKGVVTLEEYAELVRNKG